WRSSRTSDTCSSGSVPSARPSCCASTPPFPPERRSLAPADGPFSVERGGVRLAGERAGEGTPVVLLHGLTATRRYVVMGSRALERSEHLVLAYDARGHGSSSPAPAPEEYGYELLAADLAAGLDAG